MQRDYYSILGIAPSASENEIREAYFARMRVVHPDKHSKKDSKAWAIANELAAELNEAYNTLRDAGRKAAYDEAIKPRATTAPPQPARHDQNRRNPSEGGIWSADDELSAGKASWRDLPTSALASLLKRQDDKFQQQVRVPMGGVGHNYFWVVLLFGWFGYLGYATSQPTWNEELYYGYAAGSTLAALLIGVNISSLRHHLKSPLKCNLYVTPLYIIETNLEQVAFWPLWAIKKIGATHHHQNGTYSHTVLDMQFESEARQWTFRSKKLFDSFYRQLAAFDAAARQNLLAANATYFEAHDDFRGYKRSSAVTGKSVKRHVALPVVLAVAGLMVFLYADSVNQSRAAERWFYHANGQPHSLAELWQSVSTGIGATSAKPIIVPPDNQSLTGKVIEHPDRSLIRSRTPEIGDVVDESHFNTESEAPIGNRVAPPVPPQPMPRNGEVKRYHQTEAIAPLEIVTSGSESYFVKLVHAGTENVAATVFIRAAMKVQFDMPLGTFEMRYAAGTSWYGENFLFGEQTSYAKADTTFNFAVLGNRIEGYTVELFLQENGNMETKSIRPEDF